MSDKKYIELPRNGKVKEVTLSMPEWMGPLREIILIFDGIPTGIGTIQLIWVNHKTGEKTTDTYKIQRG